MKKDLDKIFNRYKDEYADWEYVDESFDSNLSRTLVNSFVS